MQTAIAPVHPTQTPEFKAWHAGSHVVNKHGEPLQVYHGTRTAFDTADTSDKGLSDDIANQLGDNIGMFFTSHRATANTFAQRGQKDGHKLSTREINEDQYPEGSAVVPSYLSLKNPKKFDGQPAWKQFLRDHYRAGTDPRAEMEKLGHDGAIIHGAGFTSPKERWYVAFHPHQVKSPFNRTFDPSDDRINFSREEIGPVEFGRRPAAGQGVIDFDAPSREYVRETTFHENKRPGEFAETKPKKDKPTTLRDSQGRVIHPTTGQVQARKGGETSEVDGQHYKAGHWMPVHGLTPKVESKPKAMATPREASGGKANEDSEKRKYTEARVLSPEDLEAAQSKKANQQKWDELNAGPMGQIKWLGDSPNRKGMHWLTEQHKWRGFAEKVGPAEIQRIIGELEPAYHARVEAAAKKMREELPDDIIEWQKNMPKESAAEDIRMSPRTNGGHEKQIPGSFYARALVQGLLDEYHFKSGKNAIDNMHDINGMLAGTFQHEFSRKPIEPVEFARHSLASTQFDIRGEAEKKMLAIGKSIPKSELAEDGIETDCHVTILYGLTADSPDELAKLVAGFGPVTIRFGKTSIFPANKGQEQRGGAQFDVLKIDIEGKDIKRLNKLVSKMDNKNTFPTYRAHATIGYLRPGEGAKHCGENALTGTELTFGSFEFSGKDGKKKTVSLIGEPAEFSREEPHAKLLQTARNIEPGFDNGSLVSCRDLRKHSGMDKPTFDKAVYHLATQGHVTPHHHDFATSLEPHELNELVDTAHGDPERAKTPSNGGRYWVGIAKNRNQEFSRVDWIYAPVDDGPVEFARRRPYQPDDGQGSFGWTDEEQETPVESSNVHSYAWHGSPATGNLLVRFHARDGKSPGPIYEYIGTPHETYKQLAEAPSKGKWVWDSLRVRGSVSGHQYPYRLYGVGKGGYIPRQAVVGIRGKNGAPSLTGEHFVPRKFQGGTSPLPQAPVRKSGGAPIPGYDINKLKFPGEQTATPAPAPVNTSTAPAKPQAPPPVNQAPQAQNPASPASPSPQSPPPPAPPAKKTLLDRVKDLFKRFRKQKPDEPKQFSREEWEAIRTILGD